MPSRLSAKTKISKYSGYFLLLIFICLSCSIERRDILGDLKALHCKKERLTFSADSLRDAVSRTLHESLPTDIDSIERERMIYINDAQVLSSFPEYMALPNTVKEAIKNADTFEKQITIRLADVNITLDSIEEQIHIHLIIKDPSGETLDKFLEQYNKSISDPCKSLKK